MFDRNRPTVETALDAVRLRAAFGISPAAQEVRGAVLAARPDRGQEADQSARQPLESALVVVGAVAAPVQGVGEIGAVYKRPIE